MQVVGAKTAASLGKGLERRGREGADGHRVGFVAGVQHPHQLGPVSPVVHHALVAHDPQAAVEQRQQGVGEAVERRRGVPGRHHLDVRRVGNVQHEGAAVDVAHVGAVGLLREDVGVVGPKAHVERLGQSRGRRRRVTFSCAGHPPAALLERARRVRDVEDAVALVIQRVARLEVARTGGHVQRGGLHEPHRVHTARVRARAVEVRQQARVLGHAHVKQVHARRLQAHGAGLVGHGQGVAHHVQGIGAQLHVGQVGLHHYLGVARIGDVHSGEILRCRFMRQPHDAASVARELGRNAFAQAPVPLQGVVGQQLHVVGQRAVRMGGGGSGVQHAGNPQCSFSKRSYSLRSFHCLHSLWSA